MTKKKHARLHAHTADVVRVAQRLGLFSHKRTLQRWVRTGVLPRPVRCGRHALHPPLTIWRLLQLAELPAGVSLPRRRLAVDLEAVAKALAQA